MVYGLHKINAHSLENHGMTRFRANGAYKVKGKI